MNRETLYLRLPILLQNLVCSLEGQRIAHKRYNRDFYRHLAEAEARTQWNDTQLYEYREQKLIQFLRHSVRTVPFYRKRFQALGIQTDQINSIQEFSSQIPILNKVEIQHYYDDFLSESVSPANRIINHTSGTTGGGLRFATTWSALHEQWATWWRYRRWHGIDLNTWCGYFGGRSVVPLTQRQPPFWRYNYPGRQVLFSGYHLAPATLPAYVNELRRRKLPWLHGYPSLLTLVANYLLEQNTDLGYNLQHITIGAENLLPHQSKAMQKAFGIKPKQHYGMAEAVANASECQLGNLHIDEDFSYVEIVNDPVTGNGQIVGTNFTNLAVPFLRYRVGDAGTLSENTCDCGRSGRILASLDGRSEDYVILKNGARIGRLDHILKDMIHVREAQIHQRTVGQITFRIVKALDYSFYDEDQLRRETLQRLGTDTDIHIEYWDELPRTKSGKLRFVISEVEDGKLEPSST